MATLVLSAAGAAAGGALGGSVAGLSTAVIGRAAGATLGKVLDQRLIGQGSQHVETGKVERFRLGSSGEGQALAQAHGRIRVPGQIIWASDFIEDTTTTSTGGKGTRQTGTTTTYSYSVNIAIALGEGVIAGVGRVWADGEELAMNDLNMSVYTGTQHQQPDPTIEAIEGTGSVPAYRGTAYVVLANLSLGQFGNRVPMFSFEIVRPQTEDPLSDAVKAVAMIPGSGEYTLATTPVYYTDGPGSRWPANVNTAQGKSDLQVSLDTLQRELPQTKAVSLVVSWFGNDLRCSHCFVQPKHEKTYQEGENMPWTVSGADRISTPEVSRVAGKPIYGGTPADASVIESIREIKSRGSEVMFYPFILMDQLDGNALPNPYTGANGQPRLPWRGRITLDLVPGMAGSPDGTEQADEQVISFLGSARASDFAIEDGDVVYDGPEEWSFTRFILHYAALCAAAGGVDSFCIGSELRGLTQIRGVGNSFPFVQALRQIAADVRTFLPNTKLGYAADWSEYFGYQPNDGSGDRYFHLDPLWADSNIDFIGIDNYMPLSDWRDGDAHLDAELTDTIYDLEYLKAGLSGGEGFDWYYANQADRDAQLRTPITDDGYGEPWIWRFKDLKSWWSNPHHERVAGVRQEAPTAWQPRSKPFWFTEYGCAAIDKGTNQPNRFLDPKSSEGALPHFSSGLRDDYLQQQYIRAFDAFYKDTANNPLSDIYGGSMVNMEQAYVWTWDARPFPAFPANRELWSDGDNHARGHWLNGRSSSVTLASVVREICQRSGLSTVDVSGLHGLVSGALYDRVDTARAALQPLMLTHGIDAVERDGTLRFVMRAGAKARDLPRDHLARSDDIDGILEQDREAALDLADHVRLSFMEQGTDYRVVAEEAMLPDTDNHGVSASEVPITLTRSEGRQIAERWLAESRVARERVRMALPPSALTLGAGDVVALDGAETAQYRIDRVEQGPHQIVEAVRVEPALYSPTAMEEVVPVQASIAVPVPVTSLFLDLPLMTGDETPHAPHIAASAAPWPGAVSVYQSGADANYVLSETLQSRSIIGLTETPLEAAPHGVWDRGAPLQVKLIAGALERVEKAALLSGANLMAIGDGTPDNWELFQFATAELIGPQTYALSDRLRGQMGTDAVTPQNWPAGSWVVLMNGAAQQLDLASNLRGVSRHYRIGPASRGYDDPSYDHVEAAFAGIGLRPFAPAHLTAERRGDDVDCRWIRRTRVDGDDWDGEVPLGEESESYRVRVLQGDQLLREAVVTSPSWTYSAADMVADGANSNALLEVAQISARFGAGLASRVGWPQT